MDNQRHNGFLTWRLEVQIAAQTRYYSVQQEQLYRLFRSQELLILTSYSVATLHELERQLEEVRFCGYTWSHAERDKGLGSVAVPLVNKDGIAHKAISVSARPARIKPEKEPLWIETIQSTASEMLDSLWGDY